MRKAVWLLAFAGMLLVACSKKQEVKFVVIGDDTLSVTAIDSLVPGSPFADSAKVIRLTRQLTLDPSLRSTELDSQDQATATELAEQLQRRTGNQWSSLAAHLLLRSTHRLIDAIGTDRKGQELQKLTDSLFSNAVCYLSTGKRIDAQVGTLPEPSSDHDRISCGIIAAVLLVQEEIGCLLQEFADFKGESFSGTMGKPGQVIKGLLGGPTKSAERNPTKAQSTTRAIEALRLRPQSSIQDTILKHSANIKALYKKALKSHPAIRGVVWVKFEVAPSGKVLSATVQRTTIEEPAFTTPLLRYLEKVQFQPVSSSAGDMKFVFPFEFAPE